MIRQRKELRGAPKTRSPRPWPTWPMRKSVTAWRHLSSSRGLTKFDRPRSE